MSFENVLAQSVTVRLPALPTGATSFSLQRASVSSAVPAPPTAHLQVWLKADAVHGLNNGDPVPSWADSSGHGQSATQSTAGQQPLWTANAINGRPALKLDGNDDFLHIPDQNDIRTVFVVVRHLTGSQNYTPLLGSQNYRFHGGIDSNLFHEQYTSPEVRNGAVFVNGVAVTPTEVAKPTTFQLISLVTTAPVNVNSLSTQEGIGGRNWNGDFAEVLLYNTALSQSDREAVENYLLTKYALGAAPSNPTWTTLETGLAGNATYQDTGLDANTRYTYRCVAQTAGADIEGTPASVTTLPGTGNTLPPDPPAKPSVLSKTSNSAELQLPALPDGATTHTLQRASEATLAQPPSANLSAWFKADSVDGVANGAPVAAWADSSGNDRGAAQTDSNWRPTWVASAINGRPALRFSGATQFLTTNWFGPGDAQASSEVTLFLVAKGANYQSLLHFQNGGNYLIYPWGGEGGQTLLASGDGGVGGRINTGLVAGEVNIGTAIWKANTANGMRTYRNGRLVAQRDSNNSVLSQGIFRIGTHQGIGEFPTADVAEILVYKTALSDSAREDVERYLATKYAVSVHQPQNLTWTSLVTGQPALATHTDENLSSGTTYWYRALAVGTGGSTPGEAVSVTTSSAAPAAPQAPTFSAIAATHLKVVAPQLPQRALSLTLQKKTEGEPNTAYSEVATDIGAEESIPVQGLSALTSYQFRFLAVGIGGSTPGPAASVATQEFDPPAIPNAPTVTAVTATSVDLQMPPLPERATSLNLQRAVASGSESPAPPTLGLQFWLKADAISGVTSGGNFSVWPDSSGNLHDAIQSNSSAQPKWFPNVLSGRPVVRLDGSDDSFSFPSQEGIRSAFVVSRHATGNQDWAPILGSPGNNLHGGAGSNLFDGYHTSAAIVNGKAYLNGQLTPVLSLTKSTSFNVLSLLPSQPVALHRLSGQDGFGDRNWNGDFAEVLLYNAALSDESRHAVERYLYDKYNIGTPPDNLTWTTIATALTGQVAFNDSGRAVNTRYFYRCVAQGPGGSTAGAVVGTTTAPAAPAAPIVSGLAATYLTATAPVLPEGAFSLTLQRKVDGEPDSSYVELESGLVGNASTRVQSLTPLTAYRFRYLAVGSSGATPGASALATTLEFDPPGAPDAPGITGVGSTQIDLQMPALPTGATSLTLQRATGLAPQVSEPPHAPSLGLRLWLRADALSGLSDGSLIANWPDQSGAGNDATQSNLAAQPKLIASSLDGRPVVRFDGNQDTLGFSPQSGIRSAFVVVRHATGSQDWAPLLGSPSNSVHGGYGSSLFDANLTSAAVRSGQTYLNGQNVPALSLSKPTSFRILSLLTTDPITLHRLSGQDGFGDRNWNGDFAEVLLYDTVLSSTDRQGVETYLMAKYGMAAAPTNLAWTTVATGLSAGAAYSDELLTPETQYFYRCVAVGPHGQTPGAHTSTVTRATHTGPPDPPAAPTVLDSQVPSIDLKLPVLSLGSTSHSVQRATQLIPTAPPSTGMTAWFKADAVTNVADGGAVETWPDSSGANHDAIQGDLGHRPTLVTSAINGRPALRFNGNAQYLNSSLSGPGGSQLTFFMVTKGSQYQSIVRFQNGGGYAVYPWGGWGGQNFILSNDGADGGGLNCGLVPNEVNIGAAIWKANTANGMRTYRNGQLVAQRNTNDSVLPSDTLHIGSYGFGWGEFPTADVAEILVYSAALSDSERQVVEQYLAGKYSVGVPVPDNLDWQTIATERTGLSNFSDSPVSLGTTYWYRCLGVGPGGATPGAAVSAIPHAAEMAAPGAPGAPTFEDITATSLKVVAPTLPERAISLTLQKKLTGEPDTAFADVETEVDPDSRTLVTELTPETTYSFRFIAVGQGGSTPGVGADATTTAASGATVTAGVDTYTVEQNQVLTVAANGVLGNDSGPQGQGLMAVVATQPTHGTLVLNQDGSFVYTPTTGYHGSDSFTYQAKSGDTVSAIANVAITVTPLVDPPVNTAPVATGVTLTTDEDTVLTEAVTATDAEDDTLTFAVTTEPEHGTLTLAAEGAFAYTPNANYHGSDSFAFKANDGTIDSAPATVSITVTSVNDLSTTEDATFTTAQEAAVETPLVASDIDGDVLTYAVVTEPAHGTLSGTAPALTYTPETGYSGGDSFTFKVNDGSADSPIATVHIDVTPLETPENTPPVAQDDYFEIPENEVLTGQLHATDADGDPLTYNLVYDAEEGHVVINPDGSFVYTPAPHSAYIYDPFAFEVSDGVHTSEIAYVYVDIKDANEAPEAFDGSVSTLQNVPAEFTLDAIDYDYEALDYIIMTAPHHGTVSTLEEGFLYEQPLLTYTPDADFSGTDTLTFKVSDGLYESQIKTVTFTVEAAPSGASPNFDALIRKGANGSFIGNDIYNATASGQTLSQTLASSATTSYELQIQNEDSVASSYTVLGSRGDSGWIPRYYDATTGGAEITSEVGSAAGWTTPPIESGESLTLRVELPNLELLSNEGGTGDKAVLVSVQGEEGEGVDAVKADIHYQRAYRPDAKIAVGKDIINSWDILGNNIYLPSGEDSSHQNQTVLQTKGSSAPASYFVYAQNDGASPDHLIVSGPAGTSDWSVQYFDALTGGQDITTAVTSTGWISPELGAGETSAIRVEVTSQLSTSFTTPFTLAVKVKSQSASNLAALSDVVKTITTRERLDLSIYTFADDKPILPGAGADINNNDGQNQIVTQPSYSGHAANFLVGSRYTGFGGTYRYTAPAGDADWTIRYFHGTDEITDEITGTGWEHEIGGGGLTNSNSDPDEYYIQDPIRIEVTPQSTVGLATDKTLLIKATSLIETEAIDAVKAVIHREPALDATIRPVYKDQSFNDYVYTGLGIHNTDAANQTVGFSQVEGQSNTAKFQIEVRNHGNVADTFVLKAPASGSGWVLHYFDAAQAGTEITTDLTSTAGWTTPSVEPGEIITVRLEASPDPGVTGALASSALIQATSVLDVTATDAVKGTYGFQRIAKLQYTLNQGVTWTDAPLATSGQAIPGLAKHVVGVRAIRLDSSIPWPFEPDIKPVWDHATFWHVGETLWIQCGAPSEELKPIQAECGNIVITNLKVEEAYQVSLSPSKTYVALDGGEVSLVAKVTKSNGQPAVGVTVRFNAKFEESGTMAGDIGGPGAGDDNAITDANGLATVTLTAGTQFGAVAVQSVLQNGGADTTLKDDQEVIFGLPQVEPTEPDEE